MSLINLIEFNHLGDERGGLISLEENKSLYFSLIKCSKLWSELQLFQDI